MGFTGICRRQSMGLSFKGKMANGAHSTNGRKIMNVLSYLLCRASQVKYWYLFKRAPVKRLGNAYVKEVDGNYYVVSKPMEDK
jgi:hypothetical protein